MDRFRTPVFRKHMHALYFIGFCTVLLGSLGCKKKRPHIMGRETVKDDGVHIKFELEHIEEVTFQGKSVRHGDVVVVPFDAFHSGANKLPISADAEDATSSIHVELKTSDLLTLQCEDSVGKLKLEEDDPYQDYVTHDIAAQQCGSKFGVVKGTIKLKNGAKVEIDGQPLKDGTFELDVRKEWYSKPVTPLVVGGDTHYKTNYDITITHPTGTTAKASAQLSLEIHILESLLAGLPASAANMPEPKDISVLTNGGHWWFSGQGKMGELSRFADIAERVNKRKGKLCRYDGGVTVQTYLEDWVIRVRGRSGEELGKKTFKSRSGGCSKVTYRLEGDDKNQDWLIYPQPKKILKWVDSLQ